MEENKKSELIMITNVNPEDIEELYKFLKKQINKFRWMKRKEAKEAKLSELTLETNPKNNKKFLIFPYLTRYEAKKYRNAKKCVFFQEAQSKQIKKEFRHLLKQLDKLSPEKELEEINKLKRILEIKEKHIVKTEKVVKNVIGQIYGQEEA
ncbi:hemerythrin-like domain-containing protein [Methanococcus voltae]|uniref:Hemerythrin-like domain-containing protein n=1 Tax=Methanococcus voltae TaxID=2188 RepID=A0A8J7RJT0_METVO|nr:hypothetical protein [Methanococcus voltae]MBP2202196.1 hemerythrin-like domain-containing protein [Methanococcus voltae]